MANIYNVPYFCLACGKDFKGIPRGDGVILESSEEHFTLSRTSAPAYCADCGLEGKPMPLSFPPRQSLTDAEKVREYRAGRYSFPPPPVCHALWTESDWIRYIDAHGRWHTVTPRQIGKGE